MGKPDRHRDHDGGNHDGDNHDDRRDLHATDYEEGWAEAPLTDLDDRPEPVTLGDMEDHRPHAGKLDDERYERELRELQIELVKCERWVKEHGEKVVVLFEGRDAAGKGGSIKRFTENLNPRGARTVALTTPTETEKGQWYFQRYVAQLPTRGEIVFFDRSWYNRAGVERVMGFCTEAEYREFLREVPFFELALVNAGTHLFKLWFLVSKREQKKRLDARRSDPLRQWKLSPIDLEAQRRYDDYTRARDAMFLATDRPRTPWLVVNSNDKKRSRLESIRAVLHALPYGTKEERCARPPDLSVVRSASELLPATD
jgi:polyphosphate kinase 2